MDTKRDTAIVNSRIIINNAWKRIIDTDIYCVSIVINGGVAGVKLDWDFLKIPPDIQEKLTQLGATPPNILVMPQLKTAMTFLNNQRAAIYRQYVISSPPPIYHFVVDKHIDEFVNRFRQLQSDLEEQKSALLESYGSLKDAYFLSVEKLLNNAGISGDLYSQTISRVWSRFPTEAKIRDTFGAFLDIKKIPKMADQLDLLMEHQELQDVVSRSQILQAARIEYEKRLNDTIPQALEKAGAELYDEMASLLERVSKSSNSERSKEACKRSVARLENLAKYFSDFDELVQNSKLLSQYHSDGNRDRYIEILDCIKTDLSSQRSAIEEIASTETHRKLAQFMV